MTCADLWERARRALERVGVWSRRRHDERRSAEARARFWDAVREGEREAEASRRR